jgi:hypothetical protein
MKTVTNIRIKETDSPDNPWEVYVPKAAFGKLIRKRFATKAQAKAQKIIYENKLLSKRRAPLSPEVHKIVAMYADNLTPFQMQTMLEEGVRRYSVEAKGLDELVTEYLEQQAMLLERGTVGQDHMNTVNCISKKLVGYLGNPLVRDIDLAMLDKMVNERLQTVQGNGEKVSPRTVRNEVNQLSAVFNYAISMEYVTKNPTLHCKLKDYKAPVGICKPADLQKLLDNADHHIQCHLMFGAFGGLRSSEIMRMRWSDVRLEEGQFFIAGTKNENAERWVNLTPPLMDFCRQALEAENPPSGLVMGGMVPQTKLRKLTKLYKAVGYTPKPSGPSGI